MFRIIHNKQQLFLLPKAALTSFFCKGASTELMIGHRLVLRLAVSIDVDGFTSPSPSKALHRSHGLKRLGTEAVLQSQPRENALQLGYLKPQNEQPVHSR
jgi:hypothetical protein